MKDYEHPVNYAKSGPASEKDTPTTTIPALLKTAVEKYGAKPALRVEREGGKKDGATPGSNELAAKELTARNAPIAAPRTDKGSWVEWTYQQYYDESAALAKAFMERGVEQFDAVAIFGFNSPEWLMASQATFMTGAKTAGIYPTDTPEQIAYKCNHSGAKVRFQRHFTLTLLSPPRLFRAALGHFFASIPSRSLRFLELSAHSRCEMTAHR